MSNTDRKRQACEAHRIALAGPWQLACGATSDGTLPDHILGPMLSASTRIRLPEDWLLLHRLAGRPFQVRRRFHRPTNLEAALRVLVCLKGWPCGAQVTLNSQPLGSITNTFSTAEFDVTKQLRTSNWLELELPANSPWHLAEEPATAAIEIRRHNS